MDDVVERRGMRAGATTDEYRDALSGEGEFGSLGYEWSDKPHRLVYDLCNEVDSLKSELSRLRSEKAPASSVEATGGVTSPDYVMVPRKASDEMVEKARMTLPGPVDICDADIEDIYETMIAPFASQPKGIEDEQTP